ncbi:group III truncated hemoglobin [Chitinophaga sp. GbtcB8]|jgi:hemoglobin|uniref:group III truncated hemoglobin n=1 Tax=Chitinophaga sp. GbtcB8 TaxID=2824753 RepID=UPI001C30857E|nr:group III truncated hemoglobin [Chitinophaga sp. GbtcB8]
MKTDITTEADIKKLVYTFYDKVRQDELLAPVFNGIIKDWDPHLEIMCQFWGTLLLYTKQYKSDPMSKHLPIPLERAHFDRWLLLFHATLDELFEGEVAENAGKRAASIARIMIHVKNIPN